MKKVKINELRMEILDKKLKQVSRVNLNMSECNELVEFTANVNFLSLRNLLSNELFLLFYFINFLLRVIKIKKHTE